MGTYKDSGIEWIGEIPREWNLDISKNIFREHKLRNYKNLENNLLSLSYGKVVQKDIESLAGLIPESFSTYNIIQKDDIVLRLTDLQNDKRSLRTALCKEDRGIITSAYLTLRLVTNNNASYLHYLLHSYDVCKVFYNLGGGVRLGGSWSDVGKLPLLLPSLQEQAAIADFLDKKNAEIDAVIAKITQQIQTLKDYRKSLITETVTKGLDKTVSYKDSGIEWIGEIPEGWEISKVKYKYEFTTGFTPNTSNTEFYDDENGAIWVTIADMDENKYIFDSKSKLSSIYIETYTPKPVKKGSLLYSFKLSVGKTAFAGTDLYTNEAIGAFINHENVNLNYLNYASFLMEFNANRNIYNAKLLNSTLIKNSIIVVPPLQEQAAISDFLDDKTTKIDCIIAKKEQQLDIIKEHRKSLIYEYVTGKKRVKEYQQDGN